ncbi:MAG TPA: ROK family transcriptional regulator [Lachnospiraceae bacterium]|nr:ROK family transcriptional regulator [Lachnospiraceae bacterium]
MSGLGVNRDYLKKRNRGLALKLVATKQCTSRIELSKEMGLTKTAISAIVGELIDRKYLVETEKEITKDQGRNPVGLEIAAASPRYAGVLIQRGYAEAILCDLSLKSFKYEKVEREWQSEQELMSTVTRLLDHMLENEENVAGIGVSSIGPVDVKAGIIKNPGYFNGIKNVEITAPLRERFSLPVYFDHDNQSAAMAEQLFGNGHGYQDILLVGIGRGVGCGIILGGKRCHSKFGYPPEIGHMSINNCGNTCICGNVGCLETYIASNVIEEKVRLATGKQMNYRDFCQREEEPEIRKIMEEMVWNLSSAIVSLVNILNFQIVLLGMDSVYWPERYVRMLEEIINERKFIRNEGTRTLVRKVAFLERTPVLGAACNALNKTFDGDLLN